jgi:predicted HD phosphohydrolase
MLPKDSATRKELPLYTFLTQFFPDAIAELVKVAVAGNRQHALCETLRWDRNVSTDNLDAALRHAFDHGMGNTHDSDGTLHLAKAAWRLLAEVQLICERKVELKAAPFEERSVRCSSCGVLETQEHRPNCATMEYLDGYKARSLAAADQGPVGATPEFGKTVSSPRPFDSVLRFVAEP